MESAIFQCFNCSSSYDLDSHIPVIPDCGDEICLDCYQNKLPKKENGTYGCCFHNDHVTEKKEEPIQNRKVINMLKSMDVLRLVCNKHKELYCQYYCTQCDNIYCHECLLHDHQSHDQDTLHKVNAANFKEYLNFINPLLDDQLERITRLKAKVNTHIEKSQILSTKDFIAMINQTKMLLKDFVQLNDIPKLSITYYQIKDSKDETQMDQTKEPEEDITEINICEINRQQNNTYQCIQDQASQYAGYYKHYLQLVNNELQKVNNSTIRKYMKDWNKAELNLLYQGSRDGFTAFKFHQLCDNKGATIAFVLSEFGKTFGGYTSVPWTSPASGVFKEDRQAFFIWRWA
eukprot:403372346